MQSRRNPNGSLTITKDNIEITFGIGSMFGNLPVANSQTIDAGTGGVGTLYIYTENSFTCIAPDEVRSDETYNPSEALQALAFETALQMREVEAPI